MTAPEAVLQDLRARGFRVGVRGHNVLLVGDVEALTPDLRGRVAECKPALLALLRAERRRPQPRTSVQLPLGAPIPALAHARDAGRNPVAPFAHAGHAGHVEGFAPLEIDAMRCALFDGTRTPAQLRALVAERRAGSRKPVTFALLGVAARTTLDRATDEDLRRALTGLVGPEGEP